MKTIVQKFGGSSLATAELREVAASRVLDARDRGVAPVIVCSALGRSPDPYATDVLLALLGASHAGPNRDLLLACGELIGAAVFAELLTSFGASAQAMTGAQAGLVTDDRFGDARVVRVDPANLVAALEHGIIPVVAGFQGATARGATTTLGRGGSDLTAIALGNALGSESVEIFTDVSGVMTGDPRRIDGAHSLERVHYEEMIELAAEGAKVVHTKAAELARATHTPYVVKGLRSNFGTVIDDGATADSVRPVTGIASRGEVAFVHVVDPDGGGSDPKRRHVSLFRQLAERGISIDMINVNAAGVFFVVAATDAIAVRDELRALGTEPRVRSGCAVLSVVGLGMRGTPGVMHRVAKAIDGAGVEIIHSTDSNITITVLVPLEHETRAQQALHDEFGLAPARAAGTRNQEAIA